MRSTGRWRFCAHLLYAAVTALLAEHGPVTLDYDGHWDFPAGVIAAVEREAPAARGLLLASSDERGVAEETFEMWRRERLVLRELRGHALVAGQPTVSPARDLLAEPKNRFHDANGAR